jgi:hypothetical protein
MPDARRIHPGQRASVLLPGRGVSPDLESRPGKVDPIMPKPGCWATTHWPYIFGSSAQVKVLRCGAGYRDTGRMTDDAARDRAIYQTLKAADEVAAALQAHLIEEHGADMDRAAAQNPSTDSFKLLRQARERLGEGLRGVEAGSIAESDDISLRDH